MAGEKFVRLGPVSDVTRTQTATPRRTAGVESPGRRRRFAVVVVVEAVDVEAARVGAKTALDCVHAPVWASDPCPVGPAEVYELTEIRLTADGELLVSAPAS